MAATAVTPVDSLVRTPLPIIPNKLDWLPLGNPEVANEHHGNHPGPELQKTIAGCALRNSFIQLVQIEYHNFGEKSFHLRFKGINMPRTSRDYFKRIFFPTVGYIPDKGVDMSGKEPVIRPISDAEMRHLRAPHPDPEKPFGYRHIRYGYEPIRDFFRDYVYGQELPLHQGKVSEFIEEDDADKRMYIGSFLLKQAIVRATDPIRQEYVELQVAGRLHPLMPPKPDDIIRWKLGMPERDEELLVDNYQQFLRAVIDERAAA